MLYCITVLAWSSLGGIPLVLSMCPFFTSHLCESMNLCIEILYIAVIMKASICIIDRANEENFFGRCNFGTFTDRCHMPPCFWDQFPNACSGPLLGDTSDPLHPVWMRLLQYSRSSIS